MEQANYIKAIVAAGLAFVTSLLGVMSVPVILLVASNVIDYATGLFACKSRKKKISSNIGILGIFKKVAMWLMVIVGMMVDEMLMYRPSRINGKRRLRCIYHGSRNSKRRVRRIDQQRILIR